jgi:protein phosphatase
MRQAGGRGRPEGLSVNLTGKIEVINLSDTGRRRPHNEDSCVTDTSLGLAVVADGMGGYKAGEVASAIAVMSILTEVKDGLKTLRPRKSNNRGEYTAQSLLLKRAIADANANIYRTAQSDPQCQGMGTTVVSLLLYDNRLSVAHVGDSRMYRLRNDVFQQVTTDHSLMQELIDRGFFTREEAVENTPKNLVTRALGIEKEVEVDIREDQVQLGDIYLMCTDGLNDMVSDEEIHLTLSKYSANLVQAGHELIRLANENGGKDNISVILVRVRERFPARTGWYGKALAWFS